MSALLIIASMWWRWADGTNKIFDGRKVYLWSAIGIALAYLCAYVGIGDPYLAIFPAGVASWSILAGFKKLGCEGWTDTTGMVIRFGVPGAAVLTYMATLWLLGWADPKIGWLIYPALQLQIAYAYKLQIETAARAFAGAAVIGALVIL